MNATKSRAPKQRTLYLLNRPTAELWGALLLTIAGRVFGYLIREFPADFGRGFEVYKIREKTTYHVHISAAGRASCDCKGGTYVGRCKHSDAITKLIATGDLPPHRPTPPATPAALSRAA